MAKRLDYRLMQVAELKQIGISTARSWRDGGNRKWFEALEKVEIENEKRKKKGLPVLGSLY
jgi:adenine specific DNA methylase Mod